ncbi:MAG: hypothetical protein DRJ49_00415 [Thermoprotei archaeon]|nr:MAG: hypothetical protein DRJ49_00415 [Thermoprotei archaeon]
MSGIGKVWKVGISGGSVLEMNSIEDFKEVIIEHFRRRGCTRPQVDISEDVIKQVDLVLQDANNLLAFRIFRGIVYSAAEFRVMIDEEILRATKLTEVFDKVYIVIPDTYTDMARSVISGRILDEVGIGIIAVDEHGNVEELLVPRPTKLTRRELGKGIEEIVGDLRRRIDEIELLYNSLKTEFGVLSEKITKIERTLSMLREEVDVLKGKLSTLPTRHEIIEEIGEKTLAPVEELPSFAKNNPWLEILRKRERE